MSIEKIDIIEQLQRSILPLQGFKALPDNNVIPLGLGSINNAFPNRIFPTAAVHEFLCHTPENAAASVGFIGGLLASLMRKRGAIIWIGSATIIFPPTLKSFGLEPDKVIFINLAKEKEILWAMEEALKCESSAAVVAELKDLSFIASRRLQLAVEKSNVTGLILRQSSLKPNTTACVTRWQITSLPANLSNNLPGVGVPHWNVELLKVRNGKPGKWQIEFIDGRFKHPSKMTVVHQQEQQKKAG
ncbi:MAG: Error-prone repair protein ImuA [Ginsengibacter sp.]